MKKIFLLILAGTLFLNIFSPVSAAVPVDYRNISSYPAGSSDRPLTFGGFLTVYFNSVAGYEGIPDSYKYIDLKFLNVEKGTPLYEALQK